jgi:hypothetical protein
MSSDKTVIQFPHGIPETWLGGIEEARGRGGGQAPSGGSSRPGRPRLPNPSPEDDGYSPVEFYTRSSDKHGHQAMVRVSYPRHWGAMVERVLDVIPTYKGSTAAFVRDAMFHRLAVLGRMIEDGEVEGVGAEDKAKFAEMLEAAKCVEAAEGVAREGEDREETWQGFQEQLGGALRREDAEGAERIVASMGAWLEKQPAEFQKRVGRRGDRG